jgi:hypothetical protein
VKVNNHKTERRRAMIFRHTLILSCLLAGLALLSSPVKAAEPEKRENTGAAMLFTSADSEIVNIMSNIGGPNPHEFLQPRVDLNSAVTEWKDPDLGITKPPIELLPRVGHRIYATEHSFLFVEVSEYKYADNGYWKPGVTGFNMPVQFSVGVAIRF